MFNKVTGSVNNVLDVVDVGTHVMVGMLNIADEYLIDKAASLREERKQAAEVKSLEYQLELTKRKLKAQRELAKLESK